MSFDEAVKIVESVCIQFKGTLQEHQLIQQALAAVRQGPLAEAKKNPEAGAN